MDETLRVKLEGLLGSKVIDSLTGFEGTCASYSVHVSGNVQVCIIAFNPPDNFVERWVALSLVDKVDSVASKPGFKL